jgi:hypothetical protein
MPLIHFRRRHRTVTGDVGSLIVIIGCNIRMRLEEWTGALSHRVGHSMRTAVYDVM